MRHSDNDDNLVEIQEEQANEYRRSQLISNIENTLSKMTLQELEALYYSMSTMNYSND